MKLELKHLAPYLPYGLNLLTSVKGGGTCYGRNINRKRILTCKNIESITASKNTKPILRPLSDLTKEIEFNGDKTKVHELLEIDSCSIEFINFENNSFFHNQPIIRTTDCEFIYAIDVYNNIIQELFKYHFDVFGLIEQGLAIDINDLQHLQSC